jgi:hypothetical protein
MRKWRLPIFWQSVFLFAIEVLSGKGIVLEVQKDQFVVSSDKWNQVLLNDCVVTK